MNALELTAVNGKQPRSFASELNVLCARLSSMPSVYEVPPELSSREWGMEVARRQELKKGQLRAIKQDLDILCLEIELAEVNLKIEQARHTTQIAQRKNERLEREEAQ